jgi:hypothetical protein
MMVKKLVQQEKGCEEEDHEVEILYNKRRIQSKKIMPGYNKRRKWSPEEEDHDCEEVYNKRRKESDLDGCEKSYRKRGANF